MSKIFSRYLPIVVAVSTVAFGAITLRQRELMEQCFIHTAYYIMTLLVITWLATFWSWVSNYSGAIKSHIRLCAPGLVLAIVLAGLVFLSLPPKLRVLYDEVNLLNVSRSFTFERKPLIVNEAAVYYDTVHPIYSYVGKRPLLFPYLISLLHTFTGYRIQNVFILNFIVFVLLLWVVYLGLRRYLGTLVSCSCLFLIAAHPIVTLTATSGIFDLMAATLLTVCLLSVWVLLKKPSAVSFQLLWMNFLLLANTRYESVLYFFVAILLLFVLKRVRGAYFANLWPYAFTPVFILPLLWQRVVKNVEPQLPAGDKLFSFQHFIDNNIIFAKALLRFDFYLPYATVVFWLGLASLVAVVLWFIIRRPRVQNPALRIWLVIAVCVVASVWVVVTSYFCSGFDNIVASRFYIPFCIVASVLPVVVLRMVGATKAYPRIVLMVSIFIFVLYHPVAMEHRMFKDRMGFIRKYGLISEFLKTVEDKNVLFISPHPRQIIIHGYGAIRFPRANAEDVHLYRLSHKLYTDIYVIQEIDYASNKPRKGYHLNNDYKLEPVFERQSTSNNLLRISRVVAGR